MDGGLWIVTLIRDAWMYLCFGFLLFLFIYHFVIDKKRNK